MPKRLHFPSLDGIRALAIVLVILTHTILYYPMTVAGPLGLVQHSQSLLSLGPLGVKIFFCLSGYLITRLMLIEEEKTGRIDLRAFYERRSVRILPIAFFYILTVMAIFGSSVPKVDYVCAFLFLQDFNVNARWLLGHLWSLGVEQQFYLLWPLAFLFKRRRMTVLIVSFVTVQMINLALYKFHFYLARIAFYSVADTMAAGCMVAILRDHPRVKWLIGARWFRFVPVLSLLLPVWFYPVISHDLHYSYTLLRTLAMPLSTLGIALSIDHFVEYPIGLLNIQWIRYLGKISYSMYIWQQMVTYLEQHGPYTRFGFWLDVPICWAAILAVSVISYELLEKPSLKLRRFIQVPRSEVAV